MLSFNEAIGKVLDRIEKLYPKKVILKDSLGCILAEDVFAPINLPPFDNSMMDGIAIQVGKLASHQVSKLKMSQVVKAGDEPKSLIEGTCAKIMTGAPMPSGANSVVPVEDVKVEEGVVTFLRSINKGQFIRFAGEDVKKGEIIATKGVFVTPRHIALFSAMGLAKISVYQRPGVGILATGNELQKSGEKLTPGKIYNSNTLGLSSLLKEIGIETKSLMVADDETAIISAVRELLDVSDVLLTVGGVSVGEYDCVKSALEKIGVRQEFWRVKIKPGKPLMFGTLGPKFIFGLPGNPVSCMITFDKFVRPAILKMMGHENVFRERKNAVAIENFEGSERLDFLRGICETENGCLTVKSAGGQNSAMLKSFADANCLIIIPEEKTKINKGENVEIELL